MTNWIKNAIFYHIYPLGACGAPRTNNFNLLPSNRLSLIHTWLDHIQSLGANALYLGPLFESSTHGYDTANYYEIDRRLGTRKDLQVLSQDLHDRGMHLVLDGVFNHVGREFWAFKDVLVKGQDSPYRDWFYNLRFDGHSPYDDPFSYEAWNGHYSLVKLNLDNPQVLEHLFGAIQMWVEEFGIGGIRLDAADSLSFSFLKKLGAFCHHRWADFWLMGEVIHGDYRQWVDSSRLDSVTNYELYKGLYSSHNDKNYFELAYTLNRQFGQDGIYKDKLLYNFADNHDINRIASQLTNPANLYQLHLLLYTIPGIPSIYYGSEFGIPGRKTKGDDNPLRPIFDLPALLSVSPQPDLPDFIRCLAKIRNSSPALQQGAYTQHLVTPQIFAFSRSFGDETIVVVTNSSDDTQKVSLHLPEFANASLQDLLAYEESFDISEGKVDLSVSPNWGHILRVIHT